MRKAVKAVKPVITELSALERAQNNIEFASERVAAGRSMALSALAAAEKDLAELGDDPAAALLRDRIGDLRTAGIVLRLNTLEDLLVELVDFDIQDPLARERLSRMSVAVSMFAVVPPGDALSCRVKRLFEARVSEVRIRSALTIESESVPEETTEQPQSQE
jgi:hypothetical protein